MGTSFYLFLDSVVSLSGGRLTLEPLMRINKGALMFISTILSSKKAVSETLFLMYLLSPGLKSHKKLLFGVFFFRKESVNSHFFCDLLILLLNLMNPTKKMCNKESSVHRQDYSLPISVSIKKDEPLACVCIQ